MLVNLFLNKECANEWFTAIFNQKTLFQRVFTDWFLIDNRLFLDFMYFLSANI